MKREKEVVMKVPESWAEKMIIGIQAALVALYIWFTFSREIKQKQKNAKRLRAIYEKEAIRYTKAKHRQKRRNLKRKKAYLFR